MSKPVIIAGAGSVGLTLAPLLHRHIHDVIGFDVEAVNGR